MAIVNTTDSVSLDTKILSVKINNVRFQNVKKTPKECLWYRDFERCKFSDCAYKHVKQRYLKYDIDEIAHKIMVVEEQLKVKN